ncbi:Chromatin assembly factor 1 subunit A [Brachionus plicatilis]|uniref:Chromatin assembly factor 1 subunit A n=1 Tax=Brachionus plicatilis TaxID=10195 RepID=A0A3M7PGI6_BRAPC|nr:Chromatin assembly factor 1 subunit A [Brachionus plicatilis]
MSNEAEQNMEVAIDKNEIEDEVLFVDLIESKSTPTTPTSDRKFQGKSSNSDEKLNKNSKLQTKQENAKKRQEEKERKEREKKEREEARLKREEEIKRKKEEEERLKQKRLEEKEREKERKAAEQAERERLKQEALKKREEEKRLKEEERKQKEEEKRKKEEEKLREEEEKKQKEEKVKNQFISFFIKKETPANEKSEDTRNLRFMPFQLKENMTVAPSIRRNDFADMNDEQREFFFRNLDKIILQSDENLKFVNYIQEIRQNPSLIRKREIRSRRKDHVYSESPTKTSKEIITVHDPIHSRFRVKYLHFNPKVYKRPPYFGTWRKKSTIVGPRRPFAKDDKTFDYEFDSDDEWEQEPDGESICDSEKDEDEEVIDEDDDDGFFVPHGHLSDDEIDEEEQTLDPEVKMAREENKREQWELERRKGSKVLIPKFFMVSDYWNSNSNYDDDSKIISQIKMFERLKCVLLNTNIPINAFDPVQKSDESKSSKASKLEASPSAPKAKNQKSKQQLNPQSPMPLNQNQTQISASPSATPSIIKFISKMSKKDIICKFEAVNGSNQHSTVPVSPVPSKKAINLATPVTPNSPKMTTSGSTAEKRVCSGNGESAVKRLKLDENQSISNEQKTPSTPNSIKNMFKKSESCKNSLKMTQSGNDSEPNKMEIEEPDTIKKDNKENSLKIITID